MFSDKDANIFHALLNITGTTLSIRPLIVPGYDNVYECPFCWAQSSADHEAPTYADFRCGLQGFIIAQGPSIRIISPCNVARPPDPATMDENAVKTHLSFLEEVPQIKYPPMCEIFGIIDLP